MTLLTFIKLVFDKYGVDKRNASSHDRALHLSWLTWIVH